MLVLEILLLSMGELTFSISPKQGFCFEWKFAIFGTKYWVGESQSSLFNFKITQIAKISFKIFQCCHNENHKKTCY
jgi:hypothetical protein